MHRSRHHQNSHDMAVVIHRPVEIVAFAVEGEKDLIQMPRISGWGWRHR